MPVGGNHGKCHTDTFVPAYLKQELGIKTMLDIGCSTGDMVNIFSSLGVSSEGIDGDPSLKYSGNIKRHDLSLSPFLGKWDLVWSVEALEHLEIGQPLDNFFKTVKCADFVFCTASQEQVPHVHVTVKPVEWWAERFLEHGFSLDNDRTETIRLHSNMQREFIRKTGMLYMRCP